MYLYFILGITEQFFIVIWKKIEWRAICLVKEYWKKNEILFIGEYRLHDMIGWYQNSYMYKFN